MTQILTDAPAQIQSNAAGPLVPAAVDARIPVFKDSGQVLRGNADTRVRNSQGRPRLLINGDAAGGGVLQGIGNQLFQHEF